GPDPGPDRAVHQARRVPDGRLRAAQAPRREGRPPAPRRARREAHDAPSRAGRVHRREGRRPLQVGPLPLLSRTPTGPGASTPSHADAPAGSRSPGQAPRTPVPGGLPVPRPTAPPGRPPRDRSVTTQDPHAPRPLFAPRSARSHPPRGRTLPVRPRPLRLALRLPAHRPLLRRRPGLRRPRARRTRPAHPPRTPRRELAGPRRRPRRRRLGPH